MQAFPAVIAVGVKMTDEELNELITRLIEKLDAVIGEALND